MHPSLFIKKYASAVGIIAVTAIVCGGIAGLLFRFAFPQEYSSEIQILVIQKYTLTDSYTASKSAEKISQNLAAAVKTSSFLEDVVDSKRVDLSNLLRLDEADRRDAWEKTLDTEVVPNASIIRITAYDTNPGHAEQIANAVAEVLMEKGSEYHGAPDTISLKVVDTALTSNYPTRPNILLNGAAAALFGAVCAAVVLFLRAPKRREQHVPYTVTHPKRAPVTHTQPGTPVHTTPKQTAPVEQAQPHEYAVLHVANFHKHLPSTEGKKYIPTEVKTLPSRGSDQSDRSPS